MFKKPIYQCDLVDDIYGFTDFGLVNGAGYNLGAETGITHIFVDNTVQNGRTYYYAVVAYDFGAPDIGPGIAPSENNAVIELDEAEEAEEDKILKVPGGCKGLSTLADKPLRMEKNPKRIKVTVDKSSVLGKSEPIVTYGKKSSTSVA